MNDINVFYEKIKKPFLEQEGLVKKYQDNIVAKVQEFIKSFDKLEGSRIKINLDSRIKSLESFEEKIIRKKYYIRYAEEPVQLVENLPDFFGIRIICPLKEDEYKIHKMLEVFFDESSDLQGFSNKKVFDDCSIFYIDFTDKPDVQKNGNHIFKYECLYKQGFDSIRFEVQVKSLVHMFWGELEHMLIYKNYEYKIGNKFFGKMMNSINDSLEAIDNQLNLMQKHIRSDTAEQRFNEIKEVATSIYSAKLQSQFENLYNTKIDLRPVFQLMTELRFKDITDNQISSYTQRLSEITNEVSRIGYINALSTDSVVDISESMNVSNAQIKLVASMREDQNYQTHALLSLYKSIHSYGSDQEVFKELSKIILERISDPLVTILEDNVSFGENSISIKNEIKDIFEEVFVDNYSLTNNLEVLQIDKKNLDKICGFVDEELSVKSTADDTWYTLEYKNFLIKLIMILLDYFYVGKNPSNKEVDDMISLIEDYELNVHRFTALKFTQVIDNDINFEDILKFDVGVI